MLKEHEFADRSLMIHTQHPNWVASKEGLHQIEMMGLLLSKSGVAYLCEQSKSKCQIVFREKSRKTVVWETCDEWALLLQSTICFLSRTLGDLASDTTIAISELPGAGATYDGILRGTQSPVESSQRHLKLHQPGSGFLR